MRIKRVTEAGARRYVNACIVYHDPSESHPFHVMHDDGTHAWIAIVDRSRVVHVNDPGNRKRVTRDFTWVTPERGTREAAAAAMMDQPAAAYGHAMDTGLSIPPGMLGQWNLGYGGAAWGGAVGANAGFDPSPIAANMGPNPAGHHGHTAIPPRSRLGLNPTQAAAVNNRRTTGDWEHRLLREFAVNLPLEEEEDPTAAPNMNAALAPQPIQPRVNNESLVQAGFLVPRQQVGADQARGLTGAPAQVPTPGTRVDQETAPSVKRAADEPGAEKPEDEGGAKRRRAATDDGGDDDEEKEEEEGEIDLLAAARAVGGAAAAATLAGRPGSEHHPTDLEGSSEDEEEETVAGSERDDGVGGSDDDDVEEHVGGGEGGAAGEEGEAAGGDTDAAVAK